MIERFFEKGLTYTWAIPPQLQSPNNDGAVLMSGLTNPPQLTYTGNNNVLPGVTPTVPAGLVVNMAIPYRWVNYVKGQTAYLVSQTTDVLTGPMSGCWICSWQETGSRHVGHLGTVDTAAPNQPPNTTVKQTFAGRPTLLHSHIRAFNPALPWKQGEVMKIANSVPKAAGFYMGQVIALVTAQNRFFSLLMFQKGNDWVCGGKKEVTSPLHRPAFLKELA